MPLKITRTLAGIVLLLPASLPAAAQPATHACASIIAPAKRLACYDRAFPPAHDAQAEASEQARAFGLQPTPDPAEKAAEAAYNKGMSSRVASVSSDRDGERVFTLDNGQVWRQTGASVLGLVRRGDAITIRTGSFHSYLLITPGGVPLRVKRVR